MKSRAFIFGVAVFAVLLIGTGLWYSFGHRYKIDASKPKLTTLPSVDSKVAVVLSPDAQTNGVTANEIDFVLKAIADQTRCKVYGPVMSISKGELDGKEQIIAATRMTMFFFDHDESGSWKLERCGFYVK